MKYEHLFPDTIIAIPLEQNMRQGGARNAGLSYAGGEYLMFCDADDWLATEAMEHLYRRAVEYDADVVQFQMFAVFDHTDYSACVVKEGNGSYLLELDSEEERINFLLDEKRAIIGNCSRRFYRMGMVREQCCDRYCIDPFSIYSCKPISSQRRKCFQAVFPGYSDVRFD